MEYALWFAAGLFVGGVLGAMALAICAIAKRGETDYYA